MSACKGPYTWWKRFKASTMSSWASPIRPDANQNRNEMQSWLWVTVELQYNKGPRDWQTMFTITRFHYIKVLFQLFYYFWGKYSLIYQRLHFMVKSTHACAQAVFCGYLFGSQVKPTSLKTALSCFKYGRSIICLVKKKKPNC